MKQDLTALTGLRVRLQSWWGKPPKKWTGTVISAANTGYNGETVFTVQMDGKHGKVVDVKWGAVRPL